MANLHKNITIIGLNGALGDPFENRQTRLIKTLIAKQPLFDDNRRYAEAQNKHEAVVREATTYANFAEMQEVYINKAKRTGATAYYLALADWFGAPKVLEINVDSWTGKMGQTIRVKARDNVMVARVSVIIRDAEENVLEMGEAVQLEPGSPWWNYTTKSLVSMIPFPIVEATAQDLPGNKDSFVIS
jgi:hypothetical protein